MTQWKLEIIVAGFVTEVGRFATQDEAAAEYSRQTDQGVSVKDLRVIEVKG